MKYFSFIAVLFLILISGCKKDDSPVNQDTTAVIMPLAVGNQWVFIDSVFNESGALALVDTATLGITGKKNVAYEGKSVEVFYWNWIYKETPDPIIWLCRNDAEGLNSYGLLASDSSYSLKKSQWIKYPAAVGDSWKNYSFVYDDSAKFFLPDTSVYSCVSTNEKIKTAKGEMECYNYNFKRIFSDGNYDLNMYFVKNVGYVGLTIKINGVVRERYFLLSTSNGNSTLKIDSQNSIKKKGKKNFSVFNMMR
jgi:hypothetical protein